MLQAATGLDRIALNFQANELLSPTIIDKYYSFLARRLSGEPVQHILGWAPFFSHKFLVGKGCFIPRFDSESIVARVIELIQTRRFLFSNESSGSVEQVEILELCCGCGAMGLSIVAELPDAHVVLVDSEPTPLKFAKLNAEAMRLSDRIFLAKRDALDEFPSSWHERFDIIVANPPYISVTDFVSLHRDVRDGEPRVALTDEGDGLSFYRRWMDNLPLLLKNNGIFITEIGDGTLEKVFEILSAGFDNLHVIKDLSGMERAVEGTARRAE